MYSSRESKKILAEKYGWQDYGGKHEESIFTAWFQSFYLFEKFGIDKRKAHYSSLINSGQMTRKGAMDLLTTRPVYPQLGIERKVMNYPKRPYTDFATDKWYGRISWLIKSLKDLYKLKPWNF